MPPSPLYFAAVCLPFFSLSSPFGSVFLAGFVVGFWYFSHFFLLLFLPRHISFCKYFRTVWGCVRACVCVWHCYDVVAVVGYVQRHLVSASVVLVV